MKPEVMVLGATGFLGAHVARALDRRGYPVHGTRRESSPTEHVADVDVEWHRADLDVEGAIDGPLEACQAVIDCAGYVPRKALEIDAAKRRGVGRLRRVFEACERADIGRIVFVSSPTTLGSEPGDGGGLLDESDFYVPGSVEDAYFEAKFSMEAEIYRYIDAGTPAVIAIPGAVFGPGDVKPATGEFLVRLAAGQIPALVEGTFNAVDVRDVAEVLVAALQKGRPGRRYVIGGENVEIRRFARMAAELCDVEPPTRRVPGEPTRRVAKWVERVSRSVGYDGDSPLIGFDMMYYARPMTSERAENELGHDPRSLESTLRDAVDWFRAHDYL